MTALWVKNWKNLNDYGCFKNPDLFDLKAEKEMWIYSSYPFRHKTTLQGAERTAKCLVTGHYSTWMCKAFCLDNFWLYLGNKILHRVWFLSQDRFWQIDKLSNQSTWLMSKIKLNWRKISFDDKNQDRKSWVCLEQTCSRSLIVLSSILCHFVHYFWWLLFFWLHFLNQSKPDQNVELENTQSQFQVSLSFDASKHAK